MIGTIVAGLFSIGKTFLGNRAEVKKAKHERQLKVISGEQTWDQIQAENSKGSWKDEFITIVVWSPFIGMFIAVVVGNMAMVQRFKEAFIVLKTDVPDEYWLLLAAVTAASMGVKSIITGIAKIRGKS